MIIFGPTNFRTNCTLPLSFRTYTRYFLVPHIACHLIAEDKDTDLEEGWEIMVRSAEVGDTLQSLTAQDDLLEDIFTENVKRYEERNRASNDETHDLIEADMTTATDPAEVAVAVSLLFHRRSSFSYLLRTTRMDRCRHLCQDASSWLVSLQQLMVQQRDEPRPPRLGRHCQLRTFQSRL
jgi:hypothetical protein